MSIKYDFKKLGLIKAIALVSFASAVSAGGPNPSITLDQTVGLDLTPGACGTDTLISVDLGTSVNYCYTVTNDGDVDFDLHTLDTSSYGQLLADFPFFLEAGQSALINDVRTPASSVINDATWTASEAPAEPVVTTVAGVDFVFDDISGTGAAQGLTDDGEANVVLPFTFSYYGTDSTDLRIGNNGAVLIGDTTSQITWDNPPLPVADLPLIAPLWDDHSTPTGEVYYEVLGVGPNRQAVVQWNDMNHFDSDVTETVTFQLVLFEGTNEIQFRYLDLIYGGTGTAGGLDNGDSATIGLNLGDGVNSYTFPDPVMDQMGISIILPPAGVLEEAEASSIAGVSVLTPQVEVDPSSIDTTVASGGMGSEVLTISNSGQGSLEWTTNEATAPVRAPRPLSYYQPETYGESNAGADILANGKSYKPLNEAVKGGGPLAYAYDVRNGFFGTFDHTNPGAFNSITPSTQAFFAGDFIDDDFSTMYAIDGDDNNLYSINTADGVATLIGLATPTQDPINEGWSGMTQDPSDGTVYVSTTTGGASFLYSIDLTTAAVTFVGEVTNAGLLIDIASSLSGDLYGFDIGSDSLLSIDKGTGAGTVIGAVGLDANFAQGMDFDNSTNTLYIAAYTGGGGNQVLQVDLMTGVGTSVGSVNPNTGGAEIDAFSIAALTEVCYLDSDIPWMSLDTTSGLLGAGGSDDVSVDFDTTGLVDGIYSANVCVFSNDPDEPLIKVPVTLQVGLDDLIFATGFEAPVP